MQGLLESNLEFRNVWNFFKESLKESEVFSRSEFSCKETVWAFILLSSELKCPGGDENEKFG